MHVTDLRSLQLKMFPPAKSVAIGILVVVGNHCCLYWRDSVTPDFSPAQQPRSFGAEEERGGRSSPFTTFFFLFLFFPRAMHARCHAWPWLALVGWVQRCCTRLFYAFALDCFHSYIIGQTKKKKKNSPILLFKAILQLWIELVS